MEQRIGKVASDDASALLESMVLDYLKRHRSRARVLELAAMELDQAPPTEDANKPIDDDWVGFFKDKVDVLETEEARVLFGKVLAGEVKQPGSFSKKALSILAEMNQSTAALFETLCNLSSSWPAAPDVRVITMNIGNPGANALSPFGMPYRNLNLLNEAGLIIADYNSWFNAQEFSVDELEVAGAKFRLEATAKLDTPEKDPEPLSRVNGVAFTAAGRELRNIVALKPNEEFIARLTQAFAEGGFVLKRQPDL